MNLLLFTNESYCTSYNTEKPNDITTNQIFSILLWIDNLLIYIISIFYIISTIQ